MSQNADVLSIDLGDTDDNLTLPILSGLGIWIYVGLLNWIDRRILWYALSFWYLTTYVNNQHPNTSQPIQSKTNSLDYPAMQYNGNSRVTNTIMHLTPGYLKSILASNRTNYNWPLLTDLSASSNVVCFSWPLILILWLYDDWIECASLCLFMLLHLAITSSSCRPLP